MANVDIHSLHPPRTALMIPPSPDPDLKDDWAGQLLAQLAASKTNVDAVFTSLGLLGDSMQQPSLPP